MRGVYIIEWQNKLCKIGCSSDIDERVKGLKKLKYGEIKEVYKIECANNYLLEKILHIKYSHKRIAGKGELFILNKLDINNILEESKFYVRDIYEYEEYMRKDFNDYFYNCEAAYNKEWYLKKFCSYTYFQKETLLKEMSSKNIQNIINTFIWLNDVYRKEVLVLSSLEKLGINILFEVKEDQRKRLDYLEKIKEKIFLNTLV